MIKKLPIATFILSLFLSLAILLPTLLQIGHIFEEHKHVSCKEVKTHLHEASVDCSLCDFHFSTFDYKPLTALDFSTIDFIYSIEAVYNASELNSLPRHYYLRGPPIISYV